MVFLIDNICRLCMAQDGVLYPIFYQDGTSGVTNSLPNKIMTFASVKLYEGDGLPALICHQCVLQVNRSYEFKLQVENSDSVLRQYANNLQQYSANHNPPVSTNSSAPTPANNDQPPKDTAELMSASSNGSSSSASYTQESPVGSNNGSRDGGTPYVLQELVPMKLEKATPPLTGANQYVKIESPINGIRVPNSNENGYVLQELGSTRVDGQFRSPPPSQDKDVFVSSSEGMCPPWDNKGNFRRMFPVERTSQGVQVSSESFGSYGPDGGYPGMPRTDMYSPPRVKMEPDANGHVPVDEKFDQEIYQCPLCEKSFTGAKNVEVHMRGHMGNGNECPVCHKRFAGNNSLRVHITIHAKVKPHQCPVCKKCFAQKGQLKVHMRLHTGERPYQCHICQEAFFQMVSLSNHIKRNHTGETPFKCMLCGKSFTSKSVLTGHINIHTRRYECPVCKEPFTRKKYLTGHIKLQHSKS